MVCVSIKKRSTLANLMRKFELIMHVFQNMLSVNKRRHRMYGDILEHPGIDPPEGTTRMEKCRQQDSKRKVNALNPEVKEAMSIHYIPEPWILQKILRSD